MSATSGAAALPMMKKKHIKAVSQKVKLFRASEPLLSVLMWGINHSVRKQNHHKFTSKQIHSDHAFCCMSWELVNND